MLLSRVLLCNNDLLMSYAFTHKSSIDCFYISTLLKIKLQIRLIVAIKGFNHSWLSCKKKYKYILKSHKYDKKTNDVSKLHKIKNVSDFSK